MQQIDQAPHRRINIKGKDQMGNIKTVREITVFFTAHGNGNQGVMNQISQAEMAAEQGDARKVEDLLMSMQMQHLIMFRETPATEMGASQVQQTQQPGNGAQQKTPSVTGDQSQDKL